MKKIIIPLLLSIILFACKKDRKPNCDSEEVTQEQSKKVRKVIIIGIDGFRSDAMQSNISPFMFNLSQSSETYYTASTRTEKTTSSGPNWASILTGVHQDKHLVLNNGFSGNILDEYPHFMSFIEKSNPDLRTVSLTHWSPINIFITKDFADYAPVVDTEDSLIFQEANSSLSQSSSILPDITFLHFDDLDHAGHSRGFHPDTTYYRETIMILDAYVQTLYNTIEDRRAQGEDWIFFIVSDHGGTPEGDHSNSQDDPNVFNTIFFANHPTIKFTRDLNNEQVNLIPTIFDYLGIESEKFNCYTDGKSLIKN